jgi:hypothetical protein
MPTVQLSNRELSQQTEQRLSAPTSWADINASQS